MEVLRDVVNGFEAPVQVWHEGPTHRLSHVAQAKNSRRLRWHTSAYVGIRQHPSAYVSIRQHPSAYVGIRQHTSAYVY